MHNFHNDRTGCSCVSPPERAVFIKREWRKRNQFTFAAIVGETSLSKRIKKKRRRFVQSAAGRLECSAARAAVPRAKTNIAHNW
jgi:hypothetical protein